MVVPDAYRAQLYLRRLTLGLHDLAAALSGLGVARHDVDATLDGLTRSITRELDSILLPTVAFELAIARRLGLLQESAPEQRYESFFATGSGWQPWVRAILPRYGFLDEVVSSLIDTTVIAVREALDRLSEDFHEVRRAFLRDGESRLRAIGLAGDGDRHRAGRRVLWFRFDRGITVMYKPIDLGTYRLFERFVRWLDLDPSHACYLPRLLPREGYGWMEFVPHLACGSERDLKGFFLRSGVLLAVAESLNLVDGHAGNLVARGPHPIIVDLETLLHHHSRSPGDGEPGVLATLMVQRPPPAGSRLGIAAGLMSPPVSQYEQFATMADHERTDGLSVTYGRLRQEAPRHLPRLGDDCVPVHDHVDDVVAGYATGYDVISDRLRSARGPAGWLQDAAGARPRVVVRPTLYYAYLLALLGQPEALICRQGAEALVRTRLARTGRYWEWEVEDLLRHDVPYFWQVPTERHLYGGSGDREEDVFPVTGIEHVTATWRRRSRRNRDANTELLRKLLPQSPRYGRAEERRARACSEWIERPR